MDLADKNFERIYTSEQTIEEVRLALILLAIQLQDVYCLARLFMHVLSNDNNTLLSRSR